MAPCWKQSSSFLLLLLLGLELGLFLQILLLLQRGLLGQ